MPGKRKIKTHGLDDLIEDFLDKGMDEDQVAKEVSNILDSLIPLGALGPAGQVLELLDGPAILLIIKAIQKMRGTPEEREARKLKREERKKFLQENRGLPKKSRVKKMTKETFESYYVIQKLGSPTKFVTYSIGLTEDPTLARKFSTPSEAQEWVDHINGDGWDCRVRTITLTTKLELI